MYIYIYLKAHHTLYNSDELIKCYFQIMSLRAKICIFCICVQMFRCLKCRDLYSQYFKYGKSNKQYS